MPSLNELAYFRENGDSGDFAHAPLYIGHTENLMACGNKIEDVDNNEALRFRFNSVKRKEDILDLSDEGCQLGH